MEFPIYTAKISKDGFTTLLTHETDDPMIETWIDHNTLVQAGSDEVTEWIRRDWYSMPKADQISALGGTNVRAALIRTFEGLMDLSDDLRRQATQDKLPLLARYHAGRAEAFATALFHVQETLKESE
jgi:hypothetical protein